jgi:ABC-type glycerol-3-phosphate transport system substrate-binding protein
MKNENLFAKEKRTMRKRLIPLIVILTAALTAAPGCSMVGGPSSTAPPDPTPRATLAPAEPTPTAASRQIVQLIPHQAFDPNADPVAARLRELTGYELIFVTLPEEGALEQISIELSVGVEYDLITLTPEQFGKLARKNVFTALDGLMSQYAPALQAVYSADEWSAAAVDGQILTSSGKPFRPSKGKPNSFR